MENSLLLPEDGAAPSQIVSALCSTLTLWEFQGDKTPH